MRDLVEANDLAVGAPLVVGFFTVGNHYEALAEQFSLNLHQHGIPYHLYAVPLPVRGWRDAIKIKPEIAQKALSQYSDRPIVQCDIDCVFRGRLGSIVPANGVDARLAWRVNKHYKFG